MNGQLTTHSLNEPLFHLKRESMGVIVQSKQYVIVGDPVPLARARRAVTSRMWDAQKAVKLARGLQLIQQHIDMPLFMGPLPLDVTFFFEPAKCTPLDALHFHKPDLSNLIKFVEDVATGILYKDDCLISSITSKKCYDKEPKTVFTITQLS